MPVAIPFFYCKHCRERIDFPFSTPQETEECQHRLPTETWKINFQCPCCDKVSLYMAQDVRLAIPVAGGTVLNHGSPLIPGVVPGQRWFRHIYRPSISFYRVEHRCGYKDCGLPHVLYVQTTEYQTERAAEQKAKDALPRPVCEAGHPFHPDYELVSVKEVFSLL